MGSYVEIARGAWILLLLCQSVFCADCVTYDFENDFDKLFLSTSVLCSGEDRWEWQQYSSVDVDIPHISSTAFISPLVTFSCVSSFHFNMTNRGVLEVNVFMGENSLGSDSITVIVQRINPGSSDTTVGNVFHSPILTNFVSGWTTLKVSLAMTGTSAGYVVIFGLAAENSVVLVDSFRYIPPNYDGDCKIYKDPIITTTEATTTEVTTTETTTTEAITTEEAWLTSTATDPVTTWTARSTTDPTTTWEASTTTDPTTTWPVFTATDPTTTWPASTTTDSTTTWPVGTVTADPTTKWPASTTTSPSITWPASTTTDPTVTWPASTATDPTTTWQAITETDPIATWPTVTMTDPIATWTASIATDPTSTWVPSTTTDTQPTWPTITDTYTPDDQNLYCTDCVTYNFGKNFDDLFIHNSGKCTDMSPWVLHRYASVDVDSPHNSSTTFISSPISRPIAPGCVSSFRFVITNNGLLQVNVYMDPSSQLLDYISVLVMSIQSDGSESVMGKLFYSPLLPNFVPGWTVLELRISTPAPSIGYISLMGMTSNSLLIVDSFRYIPPNCDEKQCVIYENATDTNTTESSTDVTTTDPWASTETFTTTDPWATAETITTMDPWATAETITTTDPWGTAETITTTDPWATAETITTTDPWGTAETITTTDPWATAETITTTDPWGTAETITTTGPWTTAETITTTDPWGTAETITTTDTWATAETITTPDPWATAETITTTGPWATAETITTTDPWATAETITTTDPLAPAETITTTDPWATAETITPTDPLATAETITTTDPWATAETITTTDPWATAKTITTTDPWATAETITTPDQWATAETITTTDPWATSETITTTDPWATAETITTPDPWGTAETITTSEPWATAETITPTDSWATSETITPTDPWATSETITPTDPWATSETITTTDPWTTAETNTTTDPWATAETFTNTDPWATDDTSIITDPSRTTDPSWTTAMDSSTTWQATPLTDPTSTPDEDLYCADCVTYNFENNVNSLFTNHSKKCFGMSSWELQQYALVDVDSPHNSSTSFISSPVTRPVTPGCVSSFIFTFTKNGLLEVNIYMDSSSQTLDYITVLATSIHSNGSESIVGKLLHSPLLPNFVPGWTILRMRLSTPGPSQGYITLMGMTTNSTLLVDSFRFIPPNCEKDQCIIYENKLDTTTTEYVNGLTSTDIPTSWSTENLPTTDSWDISKTTTTTDPWATAESYTTTDSSWTTATNYFTTWPTSVTDPTNTPQQELVCKDCVTYNFEDNFDNLFIHNSGKCTGMSPWTLQQYASVDIDSPHNSSTTFIYSPVTRPVTPGCSSSFRFVMTDNGIMELKVYMDPSSQLLDYISVLAMSIQSDGSESVVGKLFYSPLLPTFVPGWTDLKLKISTPSLSQGYITIMGMTTNSLIIVDSFRFIPSNCYEDQCFIYGDDQFFN